MTNVGRARVTLGPGDVALAGAASGVVTRAICQVTTDQALVTSPFIKVVSLASGRVQDQNAASVRSEGWEIQGPSSPCNHPAKVSSEHFHFCLIGSCS